MTDININETVIDKTSQFNVKRFKIGNKSFEFPEKTIDLRYLGKKLFEERFNNQKAILEKTKLIKNPAQIKAVLDANDDSHVNDFFGSKKWADGTFNVVTLTINFLPRKETITQKELEPFFDYYYSHSKNVLLVPNLSKKSTQEIEQITSFVENTYEYLNSMNSKPIFVPVSINLGMKKLQELFDFYIKKEYFYWWFDFEGKAINQNTVARLRRAIQFLKEKGYFDKVIFYYTNIKREILSNSGDNESGSSDILASLGGANIVGVNREPQRFIPDQPVQNKLSAEEIWRHKARKFDAYSYLYKKFPGVIETKPINITLNASRLQKELIKQKEEFFKQLELKEYIKKKAATKLHRNVYDELLN